MEAKEIQLITQILDNRDLRFVEENKEQESLAKEIHHRLGMFKIKESLSENYK